MKIFDLFLWPGTKFCEYIGVDPTADAALIRLDGEHACLSVCFARCFVGCRCVMPPRIDIDRTEILRLVRAFYARVRQDETLGPIFAAHVEDWPAHEEKITRFWTSALLFEGSYHGNPMREHMNAGNVRPEHFPRWLELFDLSLKENIPEPMNEQWSVLAHRIGRGLSLGLNDIQRPRGSTPTLR